jgi:hypothetical protein
MTLWRSRTRAGERAGSRAAVPGPWTGRAVSPRDGPARGHGRETQASGPLASGLRAARCWTSRRRRVGRHGPTPGRRHGPGQTAARRPRQSPAQGPGQVA